MRVPTPELSPARLLGLYVERHAVSLDATNGKSVEPSINWANLSEEELRQFEFLNLKLHGIAPEPERVYETVIMPPFGTPTQTAQALLEQQPDDTIVAVQPAVESLRDKILRLHREGLALSDIATILGLARSALIAALEGYRPMGLPEIWYICPK
jgi:hypothetical protein